MVQIVEAVELIQIGPPPVERACSSCSRQKLTPHFIGPGRIGGLYGKRGYGPWNTCNQCRESKHNRVSAEQLGSRQVESSGFGPPKIVRVNGKVRCAECQSTIHRTVESLTGVSDMPASTLERWTCFLGAHTVFERIISGSAVDSRGPVARPMTPPPSDSAAISRSVSEPIRPKDAPRQTFVDEGFPETAICQTLNCHQRTFIDPDKRGTGTLTRIWIHDPLGHQEHGKTDRSLPVDLDGIVPIYSTVVLGDITIDFPRLMVMIAGLPLTGTSAPTATEWRILRVMATKPLGSIVTKVEVLARAFTGDYVSYAGHHAVTVHMSRIRKKLRIGPNDWRLRTVSGIGFIMGVDGEH